VRGVRIVAIMKITPPIFVGQLRSTAYANKKYHSGLICTGAIRGFAILKFSVSLSWLGLIETTVIISIDTKISGIISFFMNSGLNFTLSKWLGIRVGVEEPLLCRRIRCNLDMMINTNGRRKCKEKNRFKVTPEMEGPPHTQIARSFPTMGMEVNKPVITVAPQSDICPHGRT
jgi:hypothetical protein